MKSTAILRVTGLFKNFGGVQAISDLYFDLAEGELLGLIGPNGSGKTTAVNLITGFVKPSTGAVVFKGLDITGLPAHRIVRLGIARTFQMVKPFYRLPAYKNMIIPLYSPRVKKMVGGKYGDRDAVALDLLEEVGFERDAFVAYKSASVLPQEPPNTCQRPMFRWALNASISATRCQVVLSTRLAWGRLLPLPRWSNSTMR